MEGECYEVLLSVMTHYEKEEIPVECSMVLTRMHSC